ncbi:MAG: sulfite exporter TauE/SafE family protein [Anaerolineales bacterium]|nr:sulfite exporter TauE/SafE family protein [Anaerolineales bacterium]
MNPVEDISLLIASFLASLFGQGGGVLYTPLQIWNGINFNNAASTSLFLILITSFSSTLVFRKAHKVDWGLALAMEVPTTLGAFLGGILSHYASARTLGLLLSILLGIAAWFMLRPPNTNVQHMSNARPSRWVWHRMFNEESYKLDLRLVIPFMAAVGLLTSMVGIGGGALKVPLMVLLFGIPLPIAIGSSAFMVGLTATAGLLGHVSMGHFDWQSALILAIPVFIGGQIGSRLSIRLNAQRLSKWFGAFIFLISAISAIHAFTIL